MTARSLWFFCLAKLSTFDISFFSKALFVSVHYVVTSEYMINIGNANVVHSFKGVAPKGSTY